MVKVLVLKGDGINCEQELAHAFYDKKTKVDLWHINDLIESPEILHDYHILALPGGFSFGDELRSGKVLATKLSFYLKDELKKFVNDKKLVIGICNGFQALIQLNAFNHFSEERTLTLTENDHGEFRDFWTTLKIEKNSSVWLNNLSGSVSLPVRHKEGRVLGTKGSEELVLTYEVAINGSLDNCAGMTDKDGLILGMMPHPEAALHPHLYPYTQGVDENIGKLKQIFKNGIDYCQGTFL